MDLGYAGLRLELDQHAGLAVEGKPLQPDLRTAGQMAPVLKGGTSLPPDTPCYYMYRGACKAGDSKLFSSRSLRFDVTVIPKLWLGDEHNKTFGHYHPQSPFGVYYAEIYEVIRGEAHYLLQKRGKHDEIERAILVNARAGEKALMPPGFGHTTVNTSGTLVMSNIVESSFRSDYAPYARSHGAAYYWTKDGLEKNPNYPVLPELEEMRAPQLCRTFAGPIADDLAAGGSIYSRFLRSPALFDFLADPSILW